MYKKLLLALLISSIGYCGQETDSRSYDMPFESALKEAKGKDKESHKMSGIDFIYVITAKKCHRFNDFKRSFAKYGVNPYRFTAFSPSSISSDTMHRTCLRGSRRLRRVTAQKMVVKKGKFILKKRKMLDRSSGYIHSKMQIKKLASALSHISIIKDALESGYENIWIMDSGTELRCDPNILSNYIVRANKEIPDWTSIYTDYSERDSGDYVEPIMKFYWRPDIDFLDPEEYLQRQYEEIDDDSYDNDDDEIDESSVSNTMGRNQSKKNRQYRERLICEQWKQNHPDDGNSSGDGATGAQDSPGTNSSYLPSRYNHEKFAIQTGTGIGVSDSNIRPTAHDSSSSNDIETFSPVGLLKGAHSYILNRKGMKLIMDWYLDHKIFIPYAQEIQIIPGMHPYIVPEPVTRNQNRN